MFIFSEKLTFWWPVKVLEPDQDKAGAKVEGEFEALFELMAPEEQKAAAMERRAILKEITPDLSEGEIEALQAKLDAHDLQTVSKVLKGWRGLGVSPTEELAFSEAALKRVYAHARYRNALTRAYLEATDDDKARLGN